LRRKRKLIVGTAIVAWLTAAGMSIAPAQADAVKITGVNDNAYGNTYGEWSAAWWQWALSIPAANSPISDSTGANCTQQQSGPVFYLAGTAGGSVTRSCTVPAGKSLFFPILNSLWGASVGDCDPTNPGVPCNLATLRKSAADAMDPVTLQAVIDGKPVKDLDQQRVQSPALTITYPADNGAGVGAGSYALNVSDGYWVLLAPLSIGKHSIYFKGIFTGGPFQGFVVEVTYNLTVQS
jgi:hypothetical protein